jgi:dUTP pyrophosphatase
MSIIRPGETKFLSCGFNMQIPEGHVGLICSRSGLAGEFGVFVLNAPGIINPGCRGPIGVLLHNAGTGTYCVHAFDRIAQLLIVKLPLVQLEEVESLSDSERGDSGFGSTGN